MDPPKAEQPIGKLITVRGGAALMVTVDRPLHTWDKANSLSSTTAQTPSDNPMACGIMALLDTSTWQVCWIPSLLFLNSSTKHSRWPPVVYMGLLDVHDPSASVLHFSISDANLSNRSW